MHETAIKSSNATLSPKGSSHRVDALTIPESHTKGVDGIQTSTPEDDHFCMKPHDDHIFGGIHFRSQDHLANCAALIDQQVEPKRFATSLSSFLNQQPRQPTRSAVIHATRLVLIFHDGSQPHQRHNVHHLATPSCSKRVKETNVFLHGT